MNTSQLRKESILLSEQPLYNFKAGDIVRSTATGERMRITGFVSEKGRTMAEFRYVEGPPLLLKLAPGGKIILEFLEQDF